MFTEEDSILGGKGTAPLFLRKAHNIPKKRQRKNTFTFEK